MAKKGGVQQLQTEINTTDELTKFLDRDGLIVMDVYTDWCGPCVAMVGSLKKIKLEQGGDDLQLAIVKCDHIDVFERFRNKSEPTWLLASKKRLVNSAFGSNVPELMELIIKELDIERRTRDSDPETSGRVYYELSAMTPIELQRYNVKCLREEMCERIEQEAAQQRRNEYLTFVTDQIMLNASDLGVSIFMPHVISRELMKRLTEPADKCQLVAKDKKSVRLVPEHVEIIEICGHDPMPPYLLDHIGCNDVFMVCWKMTESNGEACKTLEELLSDFRALIWNPEYNEDQTLNETSSLLRSITITIDADRSQTNFENSASKTDVGNADNDDGLQCVHETIANKVNVQIPPVWVPLDKRTNAALIYLYFRSMTESFLAADPIPERPHLAIAFDAYKRKDIMEVIDSHREDILAYGYFTSDNFSATELIANSTFTYHHRPPTMYSSLSMSPHLISYEFYDKMVLKVAKCAGSTTIAVLKEHGPSYVSEHTEIGRVECLAFFPVGYKNASETGETTPVPTDEKPKKKKKKRKAKQDADSTDATDDAREKATDDGSTNDGESSHKEKSGSGDADENLDYDDDDDDEDDNAGGDDVDETDENAQTIEE